MRVYGDSRSGNCFKIQLVAQLLGLTLDWQEVDVLSGYTRSPAFLSLNPNGKIPLLVLDDDRSLAESNAIIHYLAEGSRLIPKDPWQRAQMLQWQFFEQYSHEPYIAVARFIRLFLGMPDASRDEYEARRKQGYKALDVMNTHLGGGRLFFVGQQLSLADISLYAYTHVGEEAGFHLSRYPALEAWLQRVAEACEGRRMPPVPALG